MPHTNVLQHAVLNQKKSDGKAAGTAVKKAANKLAENFDSGNGLSKIDKLFGNVTDTAAAMKQMRHETDQRKKKGVLLEKTE